MANYHPTDNQLIEFSAGNLDWALGIVVSAHIQLCPQCRKKIIEFNSIGGAALSQAKPVAVADSAFSNVMQKIKTASETSDANIPKDELKQSHSPCTSSTKECLPPVVRKLLPKNKPLKWSFAAPSLRAARLETGQTDYEVCFHKILRGGKVAEHDHADLEVTLVLEGSFSDDKGNYVAGDFIVKQPGEVHRPMAAQDQDCLCLTVVAGPAQLTGLLGKVINPFLSISPR